MMTLLKSLEEVVQCVSVHDHCEVLDRHTKPMISHPILHHRRQPSEERIICAYYDQPGHNYMS